MELRRLGRSDLHIAPLMLGGNVFGWNVDEATSFAMLDAFVDAGFNAIDTADTYSRWVPGHQGGESETIIGNWLKASGKRDKVVIATKVGEDMGEGRSLQQGLHPARGRGLAAAAADRPHRSLPDPFRRRGDAAGGDHAGLCATDRAGQGARDRRLQYERRRGCRPRWPPASGSACRATRACSRSTISTTAWNSRPSTRRSARGGPRRHHLLLARRRFPHRQIPLGRRDAAKNPARGGTAQALSRRARPAHPQGARRRWRRATPRRRRKSRWPG